jgi:ribosomal protein L13E
MNDDVTGGHRFCLGSVLRVVYSDFYGSLVGFAVVHAGFGSQTEAFRNSAAVNGFDTGGQEMSGMLSGRVYVYRVQAVRRWAVCRRDVEKTEPRAMGLHPMGQKIRHREVEDMTTWHKRDWRQYYELTRRPWQRRRPPRPVYPTGLNRVLPAAGFSLSELDDAGVDLDQAEQLGLPVDAGRIGAYGPNVTVLRDFVRTSRHPL